MIASILYSIALFFGLLGGLEVGRRIGSRRKENADSLAAGPADAVVYSVLGLIVAFTFAASASRFNERRQLIVQQANALGTASLRLDALDKEDRTAIRQQMLRWIQVAQSVNDWANDPAKRDAAITEAGNIQSDVWRRAAAAVEKKQQSPLWSFVMPPINEWTDLSSTRLAMGNLGAPPMVMPIVIVLSLAASLLAGFQMSAHPTRRRLHWLAFAGILSMLIFVIYDLDNPRSGLIQVGSVDQSMAQAEESIKAAVERP